MIAKSELYVKPTDAEREEIKWRGPDKGRVNLTRLEHSFIEVLNKPR